MLKLKFAEHLKEAVTYIEQGHVRVGPESHRSSLSCNQEHGGLHLGGFLKDKEKGHGV